MARIYETPNAFQRDVLLQQKRDITMEKNSSLANGLMFLLIGGLSSMLKQAQSLMGNTPKKILNTESVFTAIESTGYVLAVMSFTRGIICQLRQNNIDNKLVILGEKEELIIKKKNSHDQIQYDGMNGKLPKKNIQKLPNQAVTTVQGAIMDAGRLQNQITLNV